MEHAALIELHLSFEETFVFLATTTNIIMIWILYCIPKTSSKK